MVVLFLFCKLLCIKSPAKCINVIKECMQSLKSKFQQQVQTYKLHKECKARHQRMERMRGISPRSGGGVVEYVETPTKPLSLSLSLID